MSNWAMYQALSGTDNWQQKRQDRAMNLMLVDKMKQDSEKELQSQMEMEEVVNKYYDSLNQFDVLAEDQERINEVEKESRRNVIKGITQYNGDLKRYMASGGISDLHNYRNSILKSDAVKNAKANKQAYAQYVDARQKGMFVGKGLVQVPVYDSEGNPKTDKKGNIITEEKSLSMSQQMALFKKGLIQRINIGNIEKKIAMNPAMFKQVYKDHNKPWAKDNVVTERDFYNVAIQRGASEEQARAQAKAYAKGLTNETAWKFKSMNDADLMKLKADLEFNKARIQKYKNAGKGSGSKDVRRIVNSVIPAWNRVPVGEMTEHSIDKKGGGIPITNKEWDYYKDYIMNSGKIAYDAHYANVSEEDRKDNPSYGKYDLSTAINLKGKELVRMKIPGTNKIEPMIKVQATWDEDNAPEGIMDYGDNRHNMSYSVLKEWDKKEQEYVERDVVTGHVYVPMGRETRSSTWRMGLNKYLGLHNRIDAGAPSVTNQMYAADAMSGSSQMLEYLMSEEGLSRSQAEQIMQSF